MHRVLLLFHSNLKCGTAARSVSPLTIEKQPFRWKSHTGRRAEQLFHKFEYLSPRQKPCFHPWVFIHLAAFPFIHRKPSPLFLLHPSQLDLFVCPPPPPTTHCRWSSSDTWGKSSSPFWTRPSSWCPTTLTWVNSSRSSGERGGRASFLTGGGHGGC